MKRITELDGIVFSEVGDAPIEGFSEISRLSAAEGMVLLKNEGGLLPLDKNAKISVFGRTQFDCYKSGTGSGGSIVTDYVSNFTDGFRSKDLCVNEELAAKYTQWIQSHPFDIGCGWATEPYYQEEMPLDGEIMKQAREFSDTAVVVIGRLAGEARDLDTSRGGYYLAECEEKMLSCVADYYDKICVVLNIGNIIDFSWVKKYGVASVLIAWQGGMEGGNACADVICGDVPACGKLADTIALDYSDYITSDSFSAAKGSITYFEDIYVGYRYFETFARDKVLYPFGFGLSYTQFSTEGVKAENDGNRITISAYVKNIGSYAGKEVLQLYYSAPQGKLGKASRELGGFVKTSLLQPGESEKVSVSVDINSMTSYDDSGVTGYEFSDVLEAGDYNIYFGTDVRSAEKIYTYTVEHTTAVKIYESVLAPVTEFKRLRPSAESDGEYEAVFEDVPLRKYNLQDRIKNDSFKELTVTGDRGIKLYDVLEGKHTMDEFISQLSAEELSCIVKGEGMNSIKTTAGTTGMMGGVTKKLRDYGIPVLNLSDGPSGIRMLTGASATSMPCGTALACTWNVPLITRLYRFEGIELRTHKMDVLLGPGINIHRDPLNGRNFEYLSEDPYLTGIMASAMVRGIQASGSEATIKHFFANNREINRTELESVLSERASREIYLKPFEIAIKNGARSVMTSYNPVNGIWNASNYDLNTVLLRNQWGFDGFVMTDWWAMVNEEGGKPDKYNLAAMVRAQNDVYMLASDSEKYDDNILKSVCSGSLALGILQRSAANICRFIMNSAAMERYIEDGFKTIGALPDTLDGYRCIYETDCHESEKQCNIEAEKYGSVIVRVTYSSESAVTAQDTIKIYLGTVPACSIVASGTDGQTKTILGVISLKKGVNNLIIQNRNDVNIEKMEFMSK